MQKEPRDVQIFKMTINDTSLRLMKTFDTDNNTANIKGLGHTISSDLSIKVKVKQVCQLIMSFGQKKGSY